MDGNDDKPTGSPPIQPPETVNSSNDSQKEKEDQVMSEIHLGCPPKFSGPFISHFSFSLPANVECVGSKCEYEAPNYSKHHLEVRLDDDGDLALPRRNKQSKDKLVVAIQHNITSSIPKVGLQVWRAELVLSDFVLHKMFTSTEFDGIVAVELGAGTGLVGMLLARAAKTVFLTDHGIEILENCAKNVHLNSAILRHKASVYVRELDWKASWPPRDDSCSTCQSYSWNVSEVKELENASLLVAADVIYSDDLTDALFTTLDQLMSQGSKKVLYLALEKRYNFSLDDLDVVANGYSQFRSYVRDESGQINHSATVVSGITWNRSLKGVRIADYAKYDFDSKENETHAIVFDKMLAWEKQLYDEVKVREQMKYEYQKKIDSLNKLKKFGASTDSLDRTKANISHLHTKYVVAMQSIDSTVCEINRLRDEQLYPKLVQLVEGMGVMWENMQKQHDDQLKIVKELRTLEISQSSKETSEQHFKNTQKLHFHAQMWNSEFQKLMIHQKEYVESLNNWLKLNLIPIDNNLSEKVSSPEKIKNPNIQSLLRTWQDHLEKLPEEGAKTAINSFEAVIDTLVRYQFDEMKMKERRDETRRELTRKTRKFEDWFNKQMAKRSPEDAMDLDLGDDKEVIAEQQIVVEALKQRLEEEEEAYRRQCVQVRDKSLMNLNSGLPDVFTAMSEYCRACSHMYRSLNSRSNPSSSN